MLDGVVTLVDGPALADGGVAHDLDALEAQRAADEELDHESPIDELFADQIGAANLIVLSKADMLDETGLGKARVAVEAQLSEPTPIIPVLAARHRWMPFWGWRWRARHMPAPSIRITIITITITITMITMMMSTIITTTTIIIIIIIDHDHGHDEFASHVIELGDVEDAEAFQAEICAIASAFGILRAKGRVSVARARRCHLLSRPLADGLTAILHGIAKPSPGALW